MRTIWAAASISVAVALWAVPSIGAPDSRAPTVSVVSAERAPIRRVAQVTGSFAARDEVLMSAEIDGLAVIEVLAEEGDQVASGQVLARLNRDTIDAQLAQNSAQIARAEAAITQAEAQIAEAQASLTQARAALQRTQSLQSSGSATADLLDQRVAAERIAVARLSSANQALSLARADKTLSETQRREIEVRLKRTEIRAKSAGIVSRRYAKLGMVAMAAAEPLFRIIADGAIDLDAEVSESTLARMAVGQSAEIDAIGRATPLTGKVRLISPEVNTTTRLGRVRIGLDDPKGVAIGSFGRANVEVARSEGILVPLSSVQFAQGGAQVQLVKDGVVETRAVTIGLTAGGKAEIVAGIKEGDLVIAVAGTFVRHGDRVNPLPYAAER